MSTVSANEVYVNTTGNDDTGNGSAENPYLTIQKGISSIQDNGTLKIGNGTYTGVNNTNITIDKNMNIIGESQDGTIIDGENLNRIFFIPSGVNVFIYNLTFINGNNTSGGAIQNNGTLTVNNCIFTSNTAGWDGTSTNYGGAINNQGTLTVNNSIFNNNNARVGGAIYNSPYATLNVNNSIFTNNAGKLGGAIYNHGTSFVKSSTFTNNTAQKGGAIFNLNYDQLLNVDNCIFTENSATYNFGGAIYNNDGNVTVKDSIFTSNSAPERGGAIYNEGILNAMGCTFTGNTANNGGAIYSWGTLTVTNSTFTDNSAISGGAIYNTNIQATLSNCTFDGNNADYGGAIYNDGGLTISGSTFTSNAAEYGGAIYNDGSLTMSGSSVFNGNIAQWYGGAICNGGTLNISDSTFAGNSIQILNWSTGGAIYNYGSLVISGSTFTNNTSQGAGGAICNQGNGLTISGSIFTGNNARGNGGAIYNYDDSLKVTNSTFTNNTARAGGAIWNYGGNVNSRIIKFNRIIGNNPNSEIYSEYGTLDATLNWWGSNSSPAGKISTGTRGVVLFDPWIVLTITANPTTINNSGNSTITADLLHDSDGIYHNPSDGHVPDIPVTLALIWGSFENPAITHSITKNTMGGAITAIFYANEGAAPLDPVKVTASADSYTTNDAESAYITINKAADLYIKITSNKTNPKVGETFILTYKLGNKGPDAAENVTITIPLPQGFELANISGDGNWTYNATTRTITWTLENVPVGDPYLYISGRLISAGTYIFGSSVSSETYNINTQGVTPLTINTVEEAKAATETVGMQETGAPVNYLILAVLMVISGLLVHKRK